MSHNRLLPRTVVSKLHEKITMKRISLLIFAAIAVISVYFFYENPSNTEIDGVTHVIGITQIIAHPALDDVRKGIISGLEKRGYKDGDNIKIIFKNANGDPSLTLPIAQEFVRMGVDILVPISTPSTLGAAKSTQTIPIIFSGVTNPIAAGLMTDLDAPDENISGTSDKWPFKQQVRAFLKLFPETKKIGMIFTNGDDVSKFGVSVLKEHAQEMGYTLKLAPVSSPQDVYPAAVNLLRDVDVIFLGIDALVLENINAVIKAANEVNKPVFAGEAGSVEKGAIMALSINMTAFGDLTSSLVVRVLQGEPIHNIPVSVVSDGDLVINRKVGEKFNLDVDALRDTGYRVIE